ncbi:MAG: HigA family addiction module antitoxin [Gammaproteobacteria bacterium]|nr:HigA family addiction module antitoxin [Gammaproteobacteria bacterium]MDE0248276.1 HigA family addiction module antitoxin [Gammaproteobacteria bacterium]
MSTADLIHPSEHLAEILEELGISQSRLAKTIGTSARRTNELVHDGRRSIAADTALRIGQALGMTPEFWLNMQDSTSFEVVENAPGGADQGGVGLRQSGIRGGTAAETRAERQTCGGQRRSGGGSDLMLRDRRRRPLHGGMGQRPIRPARLPKSSRLTLLLHDLDQVAA